MINIWKPENCSAEREQKKIVMFRDESAIKARQFFRYANLIVCLPALKGLFLGNNDDVIY